MANQLKLIFLGGVGEIGKNMTALEYGDTLIVIDGGMSFPDPETMPGIDVIIPDYEYLLKNKHKLKAIFVTHGHEDHIGGLPYLLRDVPTPVYGSNIAMAFLEHKIKKNKFKEAKTNVIKDGEIIEVGPFKVEFVRVTHSIAGAYAISITTPKGVIFFTGDFKIDHTPVDGRKIDLARIAEIGTKGVLLMLQESTNVERRGYSMSESKVGESLDNLFNENRGSRIIVATFASNIHRVQQIINCAIKYGRKVAFSGRSMLNTVEIAQKIKELKIPEDRIVDIEKISQVPYDRLCIIATGTQGEPESALTRMSQDEFKRVAICETDTVILSASPIPGNERPIYQVINNLCKKGAKVVYEALSEVHASGHAYQEELKMMLALVRPRYFIPVHGEYRHLKKHAELAEKMGILRANVLIPELGFCVSVSKAGLKQLPTVKSGSVFLVGDTESEAEDMQIRKHLAEEGIVIALVTVSASGKPQGELDIITKGAVIPDNVIQELKDAIQYKLAGGEYRELNQEARQKLIRKTMSKIFYNKMKRCPIIMPIIIEE